MASVWCKSTNTAETWWAQVQWAEWPLCTGVQEAAYRESSTLSWSWALLSAGNGEEFIHPKRSSENFHHFFKPHRFCLFQLVYKVTTLVLWWMRVNEWLTGTFKPNLNMAPVLGRVTIWKSMPTHRLEGGHLSSHLFINIQTAKLIFKFGIF
jgi:hypothetical protein